jgi:tartronate-semialdehyde synthase
MANMTTVQAAVRVLEKEGVTVAFGVPGAAFNPFYGALRGAWRHPAHLGTPRRGRVARGRGLHPAVAGNIGVCIGTSSPAGTDMITGLYAAIADSLLILCINGEAPRAKLHKEDFQAIDIESVAKPVTKWAVAVLEPGLVQRVFQQAFQVCARAGPGRC